MEIGKLKTNAKEIEGVWFQYEDVELHVCSAFKPAYNKALNDLQASLRKQYRRRSIPEEVSRKAMCELVAEHLLIDWKGFTEGGKPLPYSKERAADLLYNSVKFFKVVDEFTSDVAAYEEDTAVAAIESAKNG